MPEENEQNNSSIPAAAWNKPDADLTKPDDVQRNDAAELGPIDAASSPVEGEAPSPALAGEEAPDPAASDDKEQELTPEESGEVRPLEELLTPVDDGGTGPTGGDGRNDAFVPGDQTAAGHLTPEGARHPGGTAQADPLDPYGVNGGNALYHNAVAEQAKVLEARKGAPNAPNPDAEQPASEPEAEAEPEA